MNMFLNVKYLLIVTYPLLFKITALELSKNVPVFIIEREGVLSNLTRFNSQFPTLNKGKFSDIVMNVFRISDRVVFFVEDMLSAGDISSRDKLGSPYYLLRQGLLDGSVKHIPSVEDPYKVLQNLVPVTEYNTFHLDSRTSKLKLYESSLRHIYVFFRDGVNVSRIDALREHDLIIREVYFAVKQRAEGPVVAFYTGKVNPNAKNGAPESPFSWKSRKDAIWCRNSKAILAVEGLRIIHKNKEVTLPPTDLGEVGCTYYWNRETNPDEMIVSMPLGSYTLQCRFTFNDVTWTLVHCHLRPGDDGPALGELRAGQGSHLDFRRTFRYANTFQYNEPFDFRDSDGDGVLVKKITVEVINQTEQAKFSLKQEAEEDKNPDPEKQEPEENKNPDPEKQEPEENKNPDPEKQEPEENKNPDPEKQEPEEYKNPDPEKQEPEEYKNPDPEKVPEKEPQIVPPTPEKETPPVKKKEEYFFTEPLLTCFFISAILISLLIYGFTSLAAVNTNSRYDDPKGKPLMFTES